MHLRLFVFVVAVLCGGCRSGDAPPVSMPAEWEAHDAVWVSFLGGPMDALAIDLVRAIAPHAPVRAVVPAVDFAGNPSSRLAYEVRARLSQAGVDLSRVTFVRAARPVQARDSGPIFVRGADGALRVVDFGWNDYGRGGGAGYPFDSLMAADLGLPRLRSPLVMEGGALETNGRGTLLQVEAVTLQRNPGWTKAEVEAELGRVLGAKKVIWLPAGPAEDPHGLGLITDGHLGQGVGGHIDEFARFVGPRTILLAFPDSAEAAHDPVKRLTLARMQAGYDILSRATDQDGQPFEIVKVPVPDVPYEPVPVDTAWSHPAFRDLLAAHPQLRHGDTLRWVPAASYLNFFVTNDLVLVPAYAQPGRPASAAAKDARVQQILAAHFPGRTLVPLDVLPFNNNGGGIHCWTQQQPVAR